MPKDFPSIKMFYGTKVLTARQLIELMVERHEEKNYDGLIRAKRGWFSQLCSPQVAQFIDYVCGDEPTSYLGFSNEEYIDAFANFLNYEHTSACELWMTYMWSEDRLDVIRTIMSAILRRAQGS